MWKLVVLAAASSAILSATSGCAQLLGIEDPSVADSDGGVINSGSTLDSLVVSEGTLVPAFDPAIADYTVTLPLDIETIRVTATPELDDATVEILGGSAELDIDLNLGRNAIDVVVNPGSASTSNYVVTVDRGAGIWERAYAKADRPSKYFGHSIALSGDTLAVGAPGEANSQGAVYVFVRSGPDWTFEQRLTVLLPSGGDLFGSSVALSGDRLVVGAPLEDGNAINVNGPADNDGASDSGAAYIFHRDKTTWIQNAYLKASNTGGGDNFGTAVAIDGDTIAVGAPGEDSSSTISDSGAAYLFAWSGSDWEPEAYIKAQTPTANGEFGTALALHNNTLAVGAPGQTMKGIAGSVHVFTRPFDWSPQQSIQVSNSNVDNRFGFSVALDGDTLAVGAPFENGAGVGIGSGSGETGNTSQPSGAVYAFLRTNANWSQQEYIKASNAEPGDNFGWSVSLSGNLLVVGGHGEDSASGGGQADNSLNEVGSAYVFTRTGTVWSQRVFLKASNADDGDRFGSSVAADATTIAIGALSEASNATYIGGDKSNNDGFDSGTAYIFQ